MQTFLRLIVITLITISSSQSYSQNKIKWMTWDEALEAHAENPKKIVVDIYTGWCGWCKKMDKATFQQDHIAKYVNNNYYAVKFDAEMKDPVIFDGKEYKFVSYGRKGYHELAIAITQGKLSFPTVTFIDENLKVIQPIGGFQGPDNFEMILTYFAEDHYTHTPWRSYTRSYTSPQRGKRQAPLQSIPVKGN